MSTRLSKPLLAALLASAVASVVLLLVPEVPAPEEGLLADRSAPPSAGGHVAMSALPWVRLPVALPPAVQAGAGLSPLPPPPPVPVVAPVPVVPVVPDPGYRYLGRMVQDGRVLVFLARGEDVDVVEQGHTADPQWRVEEVSASAVLLRYLPLNEVRRIAVVAN